MRKLLTGLIGVVLYVTVSGCGSVSPVSAPISLNPAALVRTDSPFSVVYAFPGWAAGAESNGSLVVAPDGDIFGSTFAGAGRTNSGPGVVFELSRTAAGWSETVISGFKRGGPIGGNPGPMVRDAAGNLWGKGANGIFELSRSANDTWNARLVYACTYLNPNYTKPTIRGTDVYGVCGNDVIELLPSGSGYQAVTLASIPNDYPNGDLLVENQGAIYGTTTGGATGSGMVFELLPKNGRYSLIHLHDFNPVHDNVEFPTGGVLRDSNGVLYGLTVWGTAPGHVNTGSFYQLVPNGSGGYVLHVHFIQTTYGASGTPLADGHGNFYAALSGSEEGLSSNGAIVEFTPSGSDYGERVVHAFSGHLGGRQPVGSLTMDASGTMYGSTWYGGGGACFGVGCGLVYTIHP